MSSITVEQLAERCEQAILVHEDEGRHYAVLAGQEMDYETERTVIRAGLINVLVGTENPQTSKPHSATSAEAAAVLDPRYQAHLKLLSQTVVAKIKAATAMHSAYLRASLAVALIKQEVGVA